METRSIGEAHAIALYHSQWWEGKSAREIVAVQLFTDELCMPFGLFHRAMEEALGRGIFTHEFGLNIDGLRREFLVGPSEAPSLEDILAMIPEEKRIIIINSRGEPPDEEA